MARASAVEPAPRHTERSGAGPRGARCPPRRPRPRQGAHRRVPGRAPAEPARSRRRDLFQRSTRGRQDFAGAVRRRGPRARVREAGLRRVARRNGPARPQPHLEGSAARLHPARAAARGGEGPGLRARRDRQARPRPGRRPARSARPGAAPPLPRCVRRAAVRPVRGAVHHHGERAGPDPAGPARPARVHRPARLYGDREGRHRPDAPDRRAEPGRRTDGRAGPVHRRRLPADHPRLHIRARHPPAGPLSADGLPQGGARAGDRRRVARPRPHHGPAGPQVPRRPGPGPHRRARPPAPTTRRAGAPACRAGPGAAGPRADVGVGAQRTRARPAPASTCDVW